MRPMCVMIYENDNKEVDMLVLHIDGLVQDCSISSVLAMEIL